MNDSGQSDPRQGRPAAGRGKRPEDSGARALRAEADAADMVRSLLNATPDCALLIDLRGNVLAVNAAMAAHFHLTEQEILGERIYDFFSYEKFLKWKAAVESAIRSREIVFFEDLDREGRIFDTRVHPVLDNDGEVPRIAVFARDVTESKQAEDERTRLMSAIEQAAEAVIISDASHRIRYVNQAFESMTGFSRKDVFGLGADVLYQGESQKRAYEGVVKTVGRGDVWVGRTGNTRKDGTVIQLEKTVSPIRGKYGVILGYVSVWRDVTQDAILERQLRQSQKMEAIATLASGIAHDLNNILSPIIMQAELGLCHHVEPSPTGKSFRQILAAAERAAALVDQIMKLGLRREADEPTQFRLSSIVRECLKLLRPSLPSTIKIDRELESSTDTILADATQLHQVIMNLCTNAAHAMRSKGGVLTLCIRDLELAETGRGVFPDLPSGSYVLLTVRDTGKGIAPEQLDRIFDPFFTTKRSGAGTGLGLTMVQAIVAQLKGAIKVESAPGEGAAFHIALPKSAACERPARVREPAVRSLHGEERILLVDDEKLLLAANRAALKQLGYRVTVSAEPAPALKLVAENPGGYDLVLTDMTMPGMTGLDLARELHALAPGLPVMLSSGYGDIVSRDLARACGVRKILRKPYRMETLARAIRQALDAVWPPPGR